MTDANSNYLLTISSGVDMNMEHSSGSDIEGITVDDDLISLSSLEIEGLQSAQTDSFRVWIGPYDGSDNPQYEVEGYF